MKKLIYLFLSALAIPALAQQPYVSNGPRGGQARMFDLQSGQVLVAARGGIYQQSNMEWKSVAPAWNSLSCVTLSSLHTNGSEIIAGSVEGGLFFSNDFGLNWSTITGGLNSRKTYSSVAIASVNYLTIDEDSSLYLSSDQGSTWVPRNTFIGNAKACDLSVRNNNVYVSCTGGLYKSIDNGQTFMSQNTSAGLDGKMLWMNDTLWIAGSDGLRMSVDEGMSFTTAGLTGTAIGSLAVSGQNIFVSVRGPGGSDTVKYSANGGGSFSNILPNGVFRFVQIFDIASDNSSVLVGTDAGILSGNVNNTGWHSDDSGFHARQITHLGFGAGHVYATASGEGIFRSDDSGAHWAPAGSAANGAENTILSGDGYNQFVYAAGSGNFYRSTDSGVSFTAGASGLTAGTYSSVAVQKSNGNVLLVLNGELYRSTDNAISFTKLTTGIPAGIARIIYRADTSWFVAAMNDSLYQAGSSLQFRNATGIWGGITGVAHNTKRYYASTNTQNLLESTDGITWSHVSHPGTVPSQLHGIAALDSIVYLGTDNGMISNASGSWDADSLQGQIVYALGVSDKRLYAGTCNGVWARKNLPPPLVDTGVGVHTTASNLDGFSLYPNPASGNFKASFNSSESGTATLTMSDITGREVYVTTVGIVAGQNEVRIPASMLQFRSGIYFVKVQTRSRQGIQRILIHSR